MVESKINADFNQTSDDIKGLRLSDEGIDGDLNSDAHYPPQ